MLGAMRKNPFFHTVVLVGLGMTGGCGDDSNDTTTDASSRDAQTDASSRDAQKLADRVLADSRMGNPDAALGKDASLPDAAKNSQDASDPGPDARIKKDAMVAIL